MKERKNKILSLGLCVSLLAGLCGCALGNGTGADDAENTPSPITFTFYSADGSEDPWTDPVAQKITEATGVTLVTEYPSDDQDNGIALMVATGEYPDIVFAKGDANILIENNALIDLSELIDEYGPHIKELYGDEYENLRYSKDDPAIYQLCSDQVQNEIISTTGTAQLQWAVLAANNYEIPYTLDDYTRMIKSYMVQHPTINDRPTIGISISVTDWHWYTTLSNPAGYIANGTADDGQWIVDEDYNVHYKHAAEGQKEYFKWLNRMYWDGVLDPDFATQTHEDYIAKIASGRVLGLLDADWDIATAESSLKAADQYERTYAGLPVTMDESVTCAVLEPQNLAVGWGIGITTSCKDPVRAIQFIDWLCTEEAQILLNWGIEGENYYYDENGVRCRTAEEIARSEKDINYQEETGVGLHTYPFPSYGNAAVDSTGNYFRVDSKDQVIAEYNDQEKEALEAWGVTMLTDIFPQEDSFEEKYYSPLWAQVLPEDVEPLEQQLDAVAWSGLIDCIVCQEEDFDATWDKLQQDLVDAGLYEAEELMTQVVREEVEYRKSR
jgi:putative aldouronate transport system substrate-binding protein